MIFGVLNPDKIWHEHFTHLFTSPVRCSHCTMGNAKNHFTTVLLIHTSHCLRPVTFFRTQCTCICTHVQEKLLHTMVATEDVEEVEILKARFETFDEEMKANADKVDVVNQLSRQLLQNEHPNAEEVIAREDHLNKK